MMISSNKPLGKSRTILLKKSSTMELRSKSLNKSPYEGEFPTSPQLILGKDIVHSSHPQHRLSEINQPDLFTCSACKEYGSGKRFACTQCDFQMHEFCATAPPTLKNHPLHLQHQLCLCTKPGKGGILKAKCDVCGKPAKGYSFRCNACSFQMHPCCAMLSTQVKFPVHPHTLKMLAVTPSSTNSGPGHSGFVCGECKKRRSGRVYSCTQCKYYLHAVCAKNMVNGLHENNIKGPEKPSMLGTAAKLASQVVVEFIGGLIEGLGEGVGEAFAQSITDTRGRMRRATSSRIN